MDRKNQRYKDVILLNFSLQTHTHTHMKEFLSRQSDSKVHIKTTMKEEPNSEKV